MSTADEREGHVRSLILGRVWSMVDKRRRVEELEKKIDGLVTFLTLQNQQAQQSQHSPHGPSQQGTHKSHNVEEQSSPEATGRTVCHTYDSPQGAVVTGFPATPESLIQPAISAAFLFRPELSPTSSETFELAPGLTITNTEADRYLDTYQREFMPQFPFLTLEPYESAASLCREKPFLFHSVMRVTAPQSSDMQMATQRRFLEQLANQVVVGNERRLEHIQGILVQLGFGDFHYAMVSQMTQVLQIAVSLVVDLRLMRPPGWISYGPRSLAEDSCANMNKLVSFSTDPHTLHEIRAALGVYYMNAL
jgi:hypothetical protein